jgi:hypothetical protein
MSGRRRSLIGTTKERAMTVTVPLSAELCDTPCSVADCLETAHVMGSATVTISPGAGIPPDFQTVTLGLPLCTNHAHLLGPGCALTKFSAGL